MSIIVSKKIIRVLLVSVFLVLCVLFSTKTFTTDINHEQIIKSITDNKDYLIDSIGIFGSESDSDSLTQEKQQPKASEVGRTAIDVDSLFQPAGEPVKACFVSLVRNDDLWSLIPSVRSVEDRFNKDYHYTWVFLNNEPFTETFKETISNVVSGDVKFGLVPEEHWSFPSWIDLDKAAQTREDMKNIIYGDSESYRHMCRFESGFFWRHPALDEFDWYWRVEPDTKISCDIPYDVFQWMNDNKKAYGFTISIHEYESTIPTLWKTTKDFINENPEYVHDKNLMKFISEDKGETYNLCHFWSNFEVASLGLWRSEQYRSYFDYLDKSGGFFYERWGDAPVHSIAVSLFLPESAIKFFDTVSYTHPPYTSCPRDPKVWKEYNCDCDPENDFTFDGYSCGNQYYKATGMKKPSYWKDGKFL